MSVYKPNKSPVSSQAGKGDTIQPTSPRVRNREKERAYARDYYARNRDRLRQKARERDAAKPIEEKRAYQRNWVANDRLVKRERWLWVTAKRRATERGLEFTIEQSDIVIPARCPVLGIALRVEIGRGQQGAAPSLDRIDNTKGYTKENVRVVSMRANTLKGDMTRQEAEMLLKNWDAR